MTRPLLIIGQGLAGTVLSYELLTKNIPHKVIDNSHKSSATKAAAGIINPVTGRRYVKSWMIEDLLPVAKQTYKALENLLGTKLVKTNNILRSLEDLAQENRWNEATSRPGYEPYIETETNLAGYNELINGSHAYGEIKAAMQVAVPLLIRNYRQLLKDRDLLIEREFHFSELDSEMGISIDGQSYKRLVFCDGYKAAFNPIFKELPFQPAKGESFIVEIDKPLPEKLLRDKIFIAPQSSTTFWTGGGYKWDEFSEDPSADFRTVWESKLKVLLRVPFRIKDHRAGVRPSVKGRRPLIGQHNQYSNIYLFNGLGTKGTSLAPYWAKELVELLINDKPISSEVDLNRFLT